ncbi:MAG: Asp-tRNA(Asn)/Glu-tRNA(Gln) amidotransferase subunit GatC [Candidatus Staskawiczbacteria bacterium]|nr:Asp-tRNA(Asn)/Glu-tRNA(Gln) amidotransferase subunit GatC [Candidatus Staskawiczbacteria bacterium]MBI3337543.1 Asp-tRNA(Asn)/Glu-tRNA(Gln) amidotransferase subunit GatC [Candidatus Staskawiczbacteria bacterium]
MISKEEVKHIAKLARLELKEGELEKMQKELSAILDYFDLLKKANTSKLKRQPSFAKATEGQARKDEIAAKNHSLAEKIMNAFPDRKDDYIKVKAIL